MALDEATRTVTVREADKVADYLRCRASNHIPGCRAAIGLRTSRIGSFVPKRKSIGSDVGLYARPVNGRRTRAISQSGIAHNAPAESIGGLLDIQAQNLVLTKSQAACLIPLRQHKDSKPEIAIQAKLDLTKTAAGLGALARIGLASQTQSKKWYTTTSGKACRFKVVAAGAPKDYSACGFGQTNFQPRSTLAN
jgi:hypothetical protein